MQEGDLQEGDLAAFRFCPRCGAGAMMFEHGKVNRCTACGGRYFHNVATAVAVMLWYDGRLLFTERAHEPAAGKLDFPGGFVDPGETMEEAGVREVREELGLALTQERLRYCFSGWNTYPFEGVVYRIADAFFEVHLEALPSLTPADDVAAAVWRRPEAVADEELAFGSMRRALARLRAAESALAAGGGHG